MHPHPGTVRAAPAQPEVGLPPPLTEDRALWEAFGKHWRAAVAYPLAFCRVGDAGDAQEVVTRVFRLLYLGDYQGSPPTTSPATALLVAQITHAQAVGLIAESYADVLMRGANRVMHNRAQAVAAVEYTLERLLRASWQVDSRERLRGLLYTAAYRNALSVVRSQQAAKRAPAESLDQVREEFGWEPEDVGGQSPQDAAVDAEDASLIRACLDRLGGDDAYILRRGDLEWATNEVIAKELGTNMEAVKRRRQRARDKLRECYEQSESRGDRARGGA